LMACIPHQTKSTRRSTIGLILQHRRSSFPALRVPPHAADPAGLAKPPRADPGPEILGILVDMEEAVMAGVADGSHLGQPAGLRELQEITAMDVPASSPFQLATGPLTIRERGKLAGEPAAGCEASAGFGVGIPGQGKPPASRALIVF
jgi:hypothetical protein